MVWSTCRRMTLRTVRGYEINKSHVRKKYPETKNLKKLGEKSLEPSKRAVSKTGGGSFSVQKADPGLWSMPSLSALCTANKTASQRPQHDEQRQTDPSDGDGQHISISVLHVQTDRASPPSCQNTAALSTAQPGLQGTERGKI